MCDKAYETAIDIVTTIALALVATIWMVARMFMKMFNKSKPHDADKNINIGDEHE